LAVLILTVLILPAPAWAQSTKQPAYPVGVFPFAERGKETKELGPKITDLLFARLSDDSGLVLVERDDLKKVLDELELNLSGLVEPNKAAQVGHLTGAKILVVGSVVQVDTKLYLIAKIMGTETSRLLGASTEGNVRDDINHLVADLSKQIIATVQKQAGDLVARPRTRDDRIAALRDKVGKGRRPRVSIEVSERHVGHPTRIDPAVETELTLLCRELGFTVIDRATGSENTADVLIHGEGYSEFATRHGNLISVKGRLELKAIDPKSGQVIASDRETSLAVDLSEQVAGKTALQQAAGNLADRLLPALAEYPKDAGRGNKRPDSE